MSINPSMLPLKQVAKLQDSGILLKQYLKVTVSHVTSSTDEKAKHMHAMVSNLLKEKLAMEVVKAADQPQAFYRFVSH